MALIYADRCLGKKVPPNIIDEFNKYVTANGHKVTIDAGAIKFNKEKLDSFDIAHLCDILLTSYYLERFYGVENNKLFAKYVPQIETKVMDYLEQLIHKRDHKEDGHEHDGRRGQREIEAGERASRHYFVTLHALRALINLRKKTPGVGDIG